MKWREFSKILLFGAGMAGGVAAGHLFYLERYTPGGAMFALTAMFLFFAMTDLSRPRNENAADNFSGSNDLRRSMIELALLVADDALNGAKNIGRTLPCSPTELSKLEDRLMPLLMELDVSAEAKNHVAEEIDKLRARSRQAEGRRALSGGRF
ncbi:MAG: hypothetical protein LBQ90_01720 [Synergistaceae bacterium]|nr:hypothetical protein [Synergistaceae bacterium]